MLIGSSLQSISYTETKPDLVVNIEFLLTVFRIVILFGERVDLIYSCLHVLSQMLSYKSPLQYVLRGLQSIG